MFRIFETGGRKLRLQQQTQVDWRRAVQNMLHILIYKIARQMMRVCETKIIIQYKGFLYSTYLHSVLPVDDVYYRSMQDNRKYRHESQVHPVVVCQSFVTWYTNAAPIWSIPSWTCLKRKQIRINFSSIVQAYTVYVEWKGFFASKSLGG